MKKSLHLCLLLFSINTFAQTTAPPSQETQAPSKLIFTLSEDGKSWIRMLFRTNLWVIADASKDSEFSLTPELRRLRLGTEIHITDHFLIWLNLGLNGLTPSNLTISGLQSNTSDQLVIGMVGESMLIKDKLYIGLGLHYWGGLSRVTSPSTANLLTLESPLFGFAQGGYTNQLQRHLGVYAKGELGRLQYQVAFNGPLRSSRDENKALSVDQFVYATRALYDINKKAQLVTEGYFTWQFLEKEGMVLPFKTGTYLGKKKVLALGAGFISHPSGTITVKNELILNEYDTDGSGTLSREELDINMDGILTPQELKSTTRTYDVFHWSTDIFTDLPVGKGAITAYAAYANFDFGNNFIGPLSVASTGKIFFTQFGYLIPPFLKQGKIQPYLSYEYSQYDAFEHDGERFQIGSNWYFVGQHAKLVLEYQLTRFNYNGERPPLEKLIRLHLQLAI
ncbi:hypothetical protein V6R21_22670 [Limibacter armeniacum]|uniref:hypothetical protein n=1 Tax=Limibacter armeniacum TaxID=466084 RepID=UPI002FE5557C